MLIDLAHNGLEFGIGSRRHNQIVVDHGHIALPLNIDLRLLNLVIGRDPKAWKNTVVKVSAVLQVFVAIYSLVRVLIRLSLDHFHRRVE